MAKIGIVMVGYGKWEEYTLPAWESIAEENNHWEVDIVVVDNGSVPPYPKLGDIRIVRVEPNVGYAQGINAGVQALSEDIDWILILNNDVVCTGNIEKAVEGLADDKIYGNDLHKRDGRVWVDGWLYLIPIRIWDKVGNMDEEFVNAAFEDADYCFRAAALGFPTVRCYLPFKHWESMDRMSYPRAGDKREKNFNYLKQKHGMI